jgi:hypothetical protein
VTVEVYKGCIEEVKAYKDHKMAVDKYHEWIDKYYENEDEYKNVQGHGIPDHEFYYFDVEVEEDEKRKSN